tara:strand:- start:49 stop:759 length:711 start_codon:yes stop_codon:yes gene_type:complete
MSNRYLDEAGKVTSKHIDTTMKDRVDALGFFKLMGIKDITTSRQKKNGTTVYELPIRKLHYNGKSLAYKYAIYESGYIRDVSDHCSSPWYINKRYETKTKYWNSYYKEYGTYTGDKPVFINDFDDQLVYLANYILKNRYSSKLYNCCDFGIEQIKECADYRHKHKWEGKMITITRDEYNKLKYNMPLATTEGTVNIPIREYDAMCAKIDANELEKISAGAQDEIQVIINGTRYNLS